MMNLEWTATTRGLTSVIDGWIADGQAWRYWIIADTYGGGWILTRMSASAWADGSPATVARETVINAIRVTAPEDARRLAQMYESGLEIDCGPAWAHEHEGR